MSTILPVFVFTLVSDSLCPRILKFGTFIELSSTEELPPFQKNLQVNICKWMNAIVCHIRTIMTRNYRHQFHNQLVEKTSIRFYQRHRVMYVGTFRQCVKIGDTFDLMRYKYPPKHISFTSSHLYYIIKMFIHLLRDFFLLYLHILAYTNNIEISLSICLHNCNISSIISLLQNSLIHLYNKG